MQSKRTYNKHGLRKTRIYRIWDGMKQRCHNPKASNYCNYGERNIFVCAEWRDDFKTFYDWSMSNGYNDKLTIDRKDNYKGYSPENCRWVTMAVQHQNKRIPASGKASRFMGLTFDKQYNKYRVRVSMNGKHVHVGRFSNEEDGARAYDDFVIKNNLDKELNFKSKGEKDAEVRI